MKIEQIIEKKVNEVISDQVFMLTQIDKKSFNNKPGSFATMELSDDSGKIKAIKWEDSEEIFDSIVMGDLVRINGKINEYKGDKQIIVDDIKVDEGNYDKAEFIPKVQDHAELIKGFDNLVDTLKDEFGEDRKDYFDVLSNFLNSKYYNDFLIWPAAIKFHHEKLGGLLMHTLKVARHVYSYSKKEPGINFAVAMLGAIFHDIGKIKEYSFETGVTKMTQVGVLFGHKVLGMEIVKGFCEDTFLSKEEENLLLHIIASHHGKKEYGAITEPKIPEAVLVHHADLMDAECYKVIDALKNVEEGEYGYSDKYKGYIYKA